MQVSVGCIYSANRTVSALDGLEMWRRQTGVEACRICISGDIHELWVFGVLTLA